MKSNSDIILFSTCIEKNLKTFGDIRFAVFALRFIFVQVIDAALSFLMGSLYKTTIIHDNDPIDNVTRIAVKFHLAGHRTPQIE